MFFIRRLNITILARNFCNSRMFTDLLAVPLNLPLFRFAFELTIPLVFSRLKVSKVQSPNKTQTYVTLDVHFA